MQTSIAHPPIALQEKNREQNHIIRIMIRMVLIGLLLAAAVLMAVGITVFCFSFVAL